MYTHTSAKPVLFSSFFCVLRRRFAFSFEFLSVHEETSKRCARFRSARSTGINAEIADSNINTLGARTYGVWILLGTTRTEYSEYGLYYVLRVLEK